MIYALLTSNIAASLLGLIAARHLESSIAVNPLALPAELFAQSPRLFCVGTLALYADAILIILGVVLISLSNFTKLSVDTFCGVGEGTISIGGASVSVPKFGASMDGLFGDIDHEYFGYQTDSMCSKSCPCKTPTENPWAKLTS